MHGRGAAGETANAFDCRRLCAIFALMAATTVALSVFAVSNARFHAALTEEFESANAGSWNVERINGLIYATVMDTRGIYLYVGRYGRGFEICRLPGQDYGSDQRRDG